MAYITTHLLRRASICSRPDHWTNHHNTPLYHTTTSTGGGGSRDDVIVFYKWPTIKYLRIISRTKLYQLVVMSLLLPPTTFSYHHGNISSLTLITAYLAAGGTLSILITLSHMFTKVIGEMAYLPTTNQVRMSTLTFLGSRRNIVVAPQQIIPYEDKGHIQQLEVIGQPGTLRYSVRYGQVIDCDMMVKILLHR